LIVSVGRPDPGSADPPAVLAASTPRVTLDLRDEPLGEVLVELARLAGISLVRIASVSGRVTARFVSVLIGDAFESLQATGGLGWCVDGGLVSVGP
jgi:hypothetical protein